MKTDIYSLGVTFWTMLTGGVLFEKQNIYPDIDYIRYRTKLYHRKLSRNNLYLIKRMLDPPSCRKTARQLLHIMQFQETELRKQQRNIKTRGSWYKSPR